MENSKNATKSDLIKRFPFNGRSKYLIDKFYIIGYRPNHLHKILFNNINNKKSLQNIAKKINQEENLNPSNFCKSQFNLYLSKNPNMKLSLEESPSLLTEISSDLHKELPDIDLIKNMLFPNKINIYLKPELIKKNQISSRITTINDNFSFQKKLEEDNNEINNSFNLDEEENDNNLKLLNIKQYNTVFSYNPQSGKNSKKSINGFAYVFYKQFKEKQDIGDIRFTFYIPVTFCIIS